MRIIINGEGHIAGRLASIIAKRLLLGDEITVVNSEKIVITGNPNSIARKYLKRINEWKTYYNPERNKAKIPRMPDRMFRRIVRGMLPWKKRRGKEALKRLRVVLGFPEELKSERVTVIKNALNRSNNFITLEALSRRIGGMK